MLTSAQFHGVPFYIDPDLDETHIWNLDGTIHIGTKPLSWAHTEALRIVRDGLADVLQWLGQPVHPMTGPQVLEWLRNEPPKLPPPPPWFAF